MQQNMQPNPVYLVLKKAWPTINKFINWILYIMMSVIKATFRGIMEQFKGKM
jgi:hypothetical protein